MKSRIVAYGVRALVQHGKGFVTGVVLTSLLLVCWPDKSKRKPDSRPAPADGPEAVAIDHLYDPLVKLSRSATPSRDEEEATVTREELKQISSEIAAITKGYLKQRRALVQAAMQERRLEHRIAELTGTTGADPELEEALAEAEELRSRPAKPYQFSRAKLGDVLRLLAADAGISFQFSDENPLDFVVGSPTDVRVTFDMESSPFATLETLASLHGFLVARDAAGWSLEPINTDDGVKRALQWIEEFEMRGGDLSNSESVNSLAEIGMNNETIRKLIDDFRRLNPDDKIANFLPEGFTANIVESEGE